MDKVNVPVSMQSHASSVTVFNGLNFAEWNEQVQFHLGAQDLDIALLVDKPNAIIDEITEEDKAFMAEWERSNRLCLMFLRMTVDGNIKVALPDTDNAQEFLANVKARSQTSDKSLAGALMAKLTTMKYDGSRTMHAHIVEMTSLSAKLKSLGMTVDEGFLVQFILNSLPNDVYSPFQINYNAQEKKWNINELTSKLVQEEARLKEMKPNTVHFSNLEAGSGSNAKPGKAKTKKKGKAFQVSCNASFKKEGNKQKCHFCRKVGHFQKDCLKRKVWFEKKGISYDPNHKPKTTKRKICNYGQ
ncbi:uncharacterized protein LOC144564290 [Carex rostrata]